LLLGVSQKLYSLVVAREHLPAELVVDAETEEGVIMGMHHQTYPLFGLQFHPESIMTPEGLKILAQFLKCCI